MPRLVFKKGEHSPVEITGATVLGRSGDQAQIALKDNRLSRAHCRFEPRDDGQWAILDMGSQNGTFLNGRRVRESVVRPGDVVTIGQCDIVFEAIGGPSGSDLMAGVASTRIGIAGAAKPLPPAQQAGLALVPAEEEENSTRTVVAPAALTLIKGTLKDRIYPLMKDVFTIGRKVGNDIILEGDTKSSGQHAKITRKDATTWIIEDLKSTNGVTVNGHKVEEPVVIKNGAMIVVGSQHFQFTLQGKPLETSGVTAPMAAKDIAQKLASKLKEDEAPLNLEDPSIGSRSEEIDRQALNVDVRGGGKGGLIFGLAEVFLALVVVGLVLGGGYLLLQDEQAGSNSGDVANDAREGGLLAKSNPSLDKLDAAGIPEGWSFDPRGGDSLSITESTHGGPAAVQLTRFNAANSVSYLFSEPLEVTAKGFKASVFAVNSELSAGRTGTALLALFWFKDRRDSAIGVSPLAAASNLQNWTELSGSASAPRDAKFVRMALGLSGRSGSVVFDDARLEEAAAAPAARSSASIDLMGGLRWTLDERGAISLGDKSITLLREGRVTLHQVEGNADPLDLNLLLVGVPELTQDAGSVSVNYRYFDPLAEKPVELRLTLGENGAQAQISAIFSGGGADKAASRVSITFAASEVFVPSELIRLEGERVVEYRREMPEPDQKISIGAVICADTGTGNRVEAANGSSVAFTARALGGGRELFFQNQGGVQLNIVLGGRRSELAVLAGLVVSVQPDEDELDRLSRALTIIREFPYNQRELAAAAQACDSVATHYKLRHLELRDGINVPDLTRNEGLYIAAMDECIASAEKLRTRQADWAEKIRPLLATLMSANMSETTRQSAKLAHNAIEDLVRSADDFEALAKIARQARFWLRIAIEQRESTNLLASARDFIQSGLATQGRIKLRYVVEHYPRCPNGISAKSMMLDQAEAVLVEAQKCAGEGLNQIAGSLKKRAAEYVDLVESHLLGNKQILTADEMLWLLRPDRPASEDPRSWLDLESKLIERIRLLREKLAK